MINISLLKDLSHIKKYERGTVFAAGEAYVILKGEVGIYTSSRKKNAVMIASMGPGDFFGESAQLAERRAVTATALTDVFALPVNSDTITLIAANEPDMACELIRALLARLDSISADYEAICGRPWAEAAHAPHAPAIEAERPAEAKPEPAKPEPVKPDPAKQQAAVNAKISLFPEGHGSYELPLASQDKNCLMLKSYACPLCGNEFKAYKIRNSKLALNHTDSDMRNRYKGIEPLYYDVITCPECLYSALAESFDKPDKTGDGLKELLLKQKQEIAVRTGADMDTFSLFAGYYLALLCAPYCFFTHALVAAKLFLKLSWIYADCGDKDMEDECARKALDTYIDVYENEDMTGSLEQQLCLIIGELSYKAGDMKNAINFLFKAKNAEGGAPYIKKRAEDRIYEIRGID